MSNSKISNFSTFRHKLFWSPPPSVELSTIPYPLVNVGKVVAQFIVGRTLNKHIGIDVEEYFKELIDTDSKEHWGIKGVRLANIGILLEPDLSLNVEKILMDLSREYVIVIIWHHGVENSRRLVWNDTTEAFLNFPELTIHRWEASS